MAILKIGFVTPWYGETIGGGAEAELRGVVHHLHDAGIELEVLTTCVKSYSDDWNDNYHPAGLTIEYGIPVRRFLVRRRDAQAFYDVNIKLSSGLSLNKREEKIFNKEMINSPDLVDYIRKNGNHYSLFVFIPYMFGPVFHGCQVFPNKSIMIPCLHNESYAYLESFKKVFSKVKGMIFNSDPERLLAKKIYGVSGEFFQTFGLGISTDWVSDSDRFRKKYSISEPFILYAGRKDPGKKVDLLIRYFETYKKRNQGELMLVLIGGGEIEIRDKKNIMDLGFIDQQDKYDAYGAAELFCNPSQMESFSIVIMESWLAGRPVLVNGQCDVTKDFVSHTNGGLYYDNYLEFELAINYLLQHPEIGAKMGENGSEYVKTHFSWDVITEKYIAYFDRIVEGI